jgi:hypothetical protein
MIIISHRGNLYGPDKENENKPGQIQKVLDLGYYVEIDVWLFDGKLYLGHDFPQYETNISFLESNDKIICHAKNIDALEYLVNKTIHCFFHDKDDVVLTSQNWLWVYPNKKLTKNSICVLPELCDNPSNDCKGICTDYVIKKLK